LLASLSLEGSVEPGGSRAAERYVLPITPPLDQGDSDLCWVCATLSMLETNYLYRHPSSRISLSRGALQRDSIADRFARPIRGERSPLEDGGLAVEALALIRQDGLVARGDFHHIVDSGPIYAAIKRRHPRYRSFADNRSALKRELELGLGQEPPITHLDGAALSPGELAEVVLGGHQWTEFDRSRDSLQSWGPSHDPDARADTRVWYLGARPDDLPHSPVPGGGQGGRSRIRRSRIPDLWRGLQGRKAHFLSDQGQRRAHLYRADAETIHRMLNDVTVER
jgi:hypothetical protein